MVFEAVTSENVTFKAGKNHLVRGIWEWSVGGMKEKKKLVHEGELMGIERIKVEMAGRFLKRYG